ncbi:MAG: hypothetical protein AB1480_15275 [Nitrospirota bacterium]
MGKALVISEEQHSKRITEQKNLFLELTSTTSGTGICGYVCYYGGDTVSVPYTFDGFSRTKKFLPYIQDNIEYNSIAKLKIGNYEIDEASYSRIEEGISYGSYMGQYDNYESWITYEYFNESWADAFSGSPCLTFWEGFSLPGGSYEKTPTKTIDPYIKEYNKTTQKGGELKLVDYDNLDGDESFICIYSRSNVNSFWSWTEGDESESSQPPATETIEYFLAYKLKGSTTINKVSLGQKIKYTSCQINNKNIVYTYIVEGQTGDKRVIGIINISDSALPIGHRQEFELDFSGTNFDPEGVAAIGVTR